MELLNYPLRTVSFDIFFLNQLNKGHGKYFCTTDHTFPAPKYSYKEI